MAFRLILKQLLGTKHGAANRDAIAASDGIPEALRLRDVPPEARRACAEALTIRHVDSGSCNGCELEIHALSGAHYNIEALGVKFAASPRHVDLLLVTGPVTRHLETALKRAVDAAPDPKWVVAMGDCACGRGEAGALFGPNYACRGKVSGVVPVDVEVPGCPPDPEAILRGILAAVQGGRS
jgi:Ni,Fe-hydrogenase III small subunit